MHRGSSSISTPLVSIFGLCFCHLSTVLGPFSPFMIISWIQISAYHTCMKAFTHCNIIFIPLCYNTVRIHSQGFCKDFSSYKLVKFLQFFWFLLYHFMYRTWGFTPLASQDLNLIISSEAEWRGERVTRSISSSPQVKYFRGGFYRLFKQRETTSS